MTNQSKVVDGPIRKAGKLSDEQHFRKAIRRGAERLALGKLGAEAHTEATGEFALVERLRELGDAIDYFGGDGAGMIKVVDKAFAKREALVRMIWGLTLANIVPMGRRADALSQLETIARFLIELDLGEVIEPLLRLCTALSSLDYGYADPTILSPTAIENRPRSVASLHIRRCSGEAAETLIRAGRSDAFSFVASQLRRAGFERSQGGKKPGPITKETVRAWHRAWREEAQRQGVLKHFPDEALVGDLDAQIKTLFRQLRRIYVP